MFILLCIVLLANLGNIVLAFSAIGYLETVQVQISTLSAEGLFQHRTTRKALVQLLDPPEQSEEEKNLAAIVSSAAFREAVEADVKEKLHEQT
jgi:hypothetical protein